jgi:hypothetical protein
VKQRPLSWNRTDRGVAVEDATDLEADGRRRHGTRVNGRRRCRSEGQRSTASRIEDRRSEREQIQQARPAAIDGVTDGGWGPPAQTRHCTRGEEEEQQGGGGGAGSLHHELLGLRIGRIKGC